MSNCQWKRNGGEKGGDPTRCENGEGEQVLAEVSHEKENRCIPPICEKPAVAIEEQGLEELARKGIKVDQCLGEAILEAVVNIIEEVADNVMGEEGVEVSDEGGDEDSQVEKDSGSEEEQSSQSVSYNTWVDNLKNKVGNDSVLLKLVEEAKQEVESFFDNALKEMGMVDYDMKSDGLVQKANGIFFRKVAARGKSEELGLRSELRGERDRAESAPIEKEVQESEGSSTREVRKKDRVTKSTTEWVQVVEEYMKKDKEFDQKVKKALKEVNEYLWTVYDNEKDAYIEEQKKRTMRASSIFLV
nr:hypothetical protein Itr_chr03CG08120 [Ipomoea trifida]